MMYMELEKCQKSLEGYLEQKRNKFPRFYFVSNPGLLIILSQGSDPLSMNDHYEKVFDAISYVEHNKKDKTVIEKMHGDGGQGHEIIPFSTPVRATGNIEDWLCDLLKKMQLTMKDLARNCSNDVVSVQSDLSQLRSFVDNYISQFSLLGVQMLWTKDQGEALDQMRTKKNSMKDCNQRQSDILKEMSSWCLQDLGSAVNRRKIETLGKRNFLSLDVLLSIFLSLSIFSSVVFGIFVHISLVRMYELTFVPLQITSISLIYF